ncbi:MAG: D-alanine--D-alanine ligase [Wolinella sp.]
MKLALIFGGVSFEHEISIVSAIALQKILKIEHFIFVDSSRDLYLIPEKEMTSKHFSNGAYKKDPRLFLQNGGFFTKGIFGEKRLGLDVVINLVHGGDGEDGKLAGVLEFFGIPFIGPRLEGSTISFNKHLTKLYAKERGVKTLPYLLADLKKELNLGNEYPLIIKPARLGSSLGVSVAKNLSELEYARDVAAEFDSLAIVEPFIDGVKEYNLAGCKVGDEFRFSLIEEPQKQSLLDFDKKYLDFSRTQKVVEADISEGLKVRIREAFMKLYDGMFEGSIIRCDFFVNGQDVLLNEINPIPGSLANYLFSDFSSIVEAMARSLPRERQIPITYRYIHKIQHAKGK